MASYSLRTTDASQQSPVLAKGKVQIRASAPIFWKIGENPTASRQGCAILPANQTLELVLPVNCSKLAVLAVKEPANVTVIESNGGARASCSA